MKHMTLNVVGTRLIQRKHAWECLIKSNIIKVAEKEEEYAETVLRKTST